MKAAELAKETGNDIPDHLIPPDLVPGASEFFTAFWELSSDRQLGMSIGPIPSRSLIQWAAAAGYDPDELASFRGAIRAMDDVFLKQLRAQQEAKQPETGDHISSRPLTMDLFDAMFTGKKPGQTLSPKLFKAMFTK